ncbi:MAG: ANTAR domain-containing protein [Armatimonadetes bacterium]|nr:ANTAR domain-containing protein [Armatimonadota bacterium]
MSSHSIGAAVRRVVVCAGERHVRVGLRRALAHSGLDVYACGASRIEYARALGSAGSAVVVLAPGSVTEALSSAPLLHQGRAAPVVLVLPGQSRIDAAEAARAGIYGVLTEPAPAEALVASIHIAFGVWRRSSDLAARAVNLNSEWRTLKTVGRAVGVLMDSYGLAYADALARLEHLSARQNTTLYRVAEAVILAHGVTALAA